MSSIAPSEIWQEWPAFTGERLTAHKYPRRVYLLDALPKTANGKIKRRDLR